MKTTQRGMSLIEIMVGVVIGLIGCVVIFQMYMVAEGRKRTVSSGSDMEISGRLGLMSLERDLQAAATATAWPHRGAPPWGARRSAAT